jgi:hypothetical protein
MKNIRLGLLPLLGLTIAASSALCRDWGLKLSAPRTVIGLDDDFLITVTLTRPDEHGWYDYAYDIEIRDGAGQKVPDSTYGKRLRNSVFLSGGGLPGHHPLAPVGEAVTTFNLSPYFDIDKPGNYTVSVGQRGYAPGSLVITVLPVLAGTEATTRQNGSGADARPVAPPAQGNAPRTGDFSLTIAADREAPVAEADIHIVTLFNNPTKGTVAVPLISDGRGLIFDVRGPDGRAVPETDEGRLTKALVADGTTKLGAFPLGAGSSFSMDTVINRLVDMTRVGTYTLQFYMTLPEELGGGEIRSNVISLTVRERRATQ